MAGSFTRNVLPNPDDGKDRSHFLPLPLWVFVVRIVQASFGLLVLILSAASAGNYRIVTSIGQGFGIFAGLWTLLYFGYIALAVYSLPQIYNIWAHLALECLSVLWWLSSFGALAAEVATLAVLGYFTNGSLQYSFDRVAHAAGIGCHQGATGLAAITWLLFIVTLIFLSIDVHRARVGKTSSQPKNGPPVEVAGGVEMTQQQPQQDNKQAYTQQQQPLLSHPTPQGAPQTPYSDQSYPQQQQQPPQEHGQTPQTYSPQPYPQQNPPYPQTQPYQQQTQAFPPQNETYPQQGQAYPPHQDYRHA